MSIRAPFIVCSGLDGCGKSTQIQQLLEHYQSKGKRVVWRWSRGGYTPLFLFLKACLRRVAGKKLPSAGRTDTRDAMLKRKGVSTLWLWLSIADMALYYGLYFRLLGWTGTVLIADRYIGDTELDFSLNFPGIPFTSWWIWKLMEALSRKADHYIYLDIPLDVSLERLAKKDEPFPDTPEVLAERQALYKKMIEERHYCVVNANQSIDYVARDVLETMR